MSVTVQFSYGPSVVRQRVFDSTAALVVELQRVAGVPQTGIWDDRTNAAVVERLARLGAAEPAQTLRDLARDQRQIVPTDLAAAAYSIAETPPGHVMVRNAQPFRWGTMAPAQPAETISAEPLPTTVPPPGLPWYRLGPLGMAAGGVAAAAGAAMIAVRWFAPKR